MKKKSLSGEHAKKKKKNTADLPPIHQTTNKYIVASHGLLKLQLHHNMPIEFLEFANPITNNITFLYFTNKKHTFLDFTYTPHNRCIPINISSP